MHIFVGKHNLTTLSRAGEGVARTPDAPEPNSTAFAAVLFFYVRPQTACPAKADAAVCTRGGWTRRRILAARIKKGISPKRRRYPIIRWQKARRQMVNSSQPGVSEEAERIPLGVSLPRLLLALEVDIT